MSEHHSERVSSLYPQSVAKKYARGGIIAIIIENAPTATRWEYVQNVSKLHLASIDWISEIILDY